MISRLINIAGTSILSLAILAGTLFLISQKEGKNIVYTAPPLLSFTVDTAEPTAIELTQKLTGKGILTLGKFTKVRLDNETTLTVIAADFDEYDKLMNATLQIEQGRIWLANNVWGTKITVKDKLASATSQGGTLIFSSQKNANNEQLTQIAAIDSPVAIATITDTIAPVTLLDPGKTTILTPSTAIKLANEDSFLRQAVWKTLTTTNNSNLDFFRKANQTLDIRFLNHLISQQRNSQNTPTETTWLRKLRKYLTFLPNPEVRLWSTEATEMLRAATDDPTGSQLISLSTLLKDNSFGGRHELVSAIAKLLPYTRLQSYPQLATDNLLNLNKLSNLESQISNLIKERPLTYNLALAHRLQLTSAMMKEQPELAAQNLSQLGKEIFEAKNLTANESSFLGKTLLAFFQAQPTQITTQLIDAYHALNKFRSKKPFTLASALDDQVTLVQLLITTDQRTLAPLAAYKLKKLLKLGGQYLTSEQFIRLADLGVDLSNRATYLQTLDPNTKLDENSYQDWIAAQAIATAKAETNQDSNTNLDQSSKTTETDTTAPDQVAKKPKNNFIEEFFDLIKLTDNTLVVDLVETPIDNQTDKKNQDTEVTKKTVKEEEITKSDRTVEIIYNSSDGRIARPGELVESATPVSPPKSAVKKDTKDISTVIVYDPNDGKIARPRLDFTPEIKILD